MLMSSPHVALLCALLVLVLCCVRHGDHVQFWLATAATYSGLSPKQRRLIRVSNWTRHGKEVELPWLAMDPDTRTFQALQNKPRAVDLGDLHWIQASWAPTQRTLSEVKEALLQDGYAVLDEDCEGFRDIDVPAIMDILVQHSKIPKEMRDQATVFWKLLQQVEPLLAKSGGLKKLDVWSKLFEGSTSSLHVDGIMNTLNIWVPESPTQELPQALLYLAGSNNSKGIMRQYIEDNRAQLNTFSEQGDLSSVSSILGHQGAVPHNECLVPASVLKMGKVALPGRAVLFRSGGLHHGATYHAGYNLPGSSGGALIMRLLLGDWPQTISEAWAMVGVHFQGGQPQET